MSTKAAITYSDIAHNLSLLEEHEIIAAINLLVSFEYDEAKLINEVNIKLSQLGKPIIQMPA